ncbi:MANBA [Branchiostoma lanceolatum]|uniref:Beta-mannosidase n=1 Tax=Branchiostoma lanceolatum TaxID=7740 RepID=A0A8J9Z2M1_BRALA|nr:MANBA [Branchiostoma lanceolatum]
MAGVKFVLLFILVILGLSYEEGIDLNGEWNVENNKGDIKIRGKVPGCVHTDLMAAGKIGDPYYRFNDVEYRWIAKENWTYSREFDVPGGMLDFNELLLLCEGLDTVATIFVNGKFVGQSDNMFKRYMFDLKSVLKSGRNAIAVNFTSAITYAMEKNASHTQYMVPPDCPPAVQKGECHPNFIRKEQCSFSWDWGPAFATQGIWKNISIQGYDNSVIRDVLITTRKGDGRSVSWKVDVNVFIDVASTATNTPLTGILNAQLEGFQVSVNKTVTLSAPKESVTLTMNISPDIGVGKWWPVGYGRQMLYNLRVSFINKELGEGPTKTVKFGFRTVELVQEKIPGSPGLSFYFKINDLPIFMKGSNWIPADAFKNRITPEYTRYLLQSAVDANMNTLRVWGGGIYEHDDVYDIADELGIMIWQDFMFACAMYPVDDDFLGNVREEIQQQVVRIGNHPAVIAWSGNNENEAALATNWYGTDNSSWLYYTFRADYVKLYIDVIKPEVESLDQSRPFISSSPSNGKETVMEHSVAHDPYDNHYGDVHYYNYLTDCWDWTTFPKTRFASEYGFQSWPSFHTLKNASEEGDWTLNSGFNNHRQHHGDGNAQMMDQVMLHFPLPTGGDSLQQYKDFIYLSQVAQAMCIKTESEFYRRSRSEIVNGTGHTMGALYWQLNDIWQGPTWSSVEYGGRWKMLHYYAAKFFAPVMTVIFEDKEQLKVYAVSDLAIKQNQVTSQLQLWTWSSFKPLQNWTVTFDMEANAAMMVINMTTTQLIKNGGCPARETCYFTSAVCLNKTRLFGPVNAHFLISFQSAKGLTKAKITVTNVTVLPDASKARAATTLRLELKTTAPAPFVWLDAGDLEGRFSDNGFLMNTETITLEFYARKSVTVAMFQKEVTVQSLMDIKRENY